MGAIAVFCAIWGASLSTLLGVLRLVEWLERRCGRLRVTVDPDYRWWDDKGPMEDVEAGVVFRATNCGEKPLMVVGLTLAVNNRAIDITPSTQGDKNHKVLHESEVFERVTIRRGDLILNIQKETGRRPPFKCRAVVHTSIGRRYRS